MYTLLNLEASEQEKVIDGQQYTQPIVTSQQQVIQ
jgi:hypothetical protein